MSKINVLEKTFVIPRYVYIWVPNKALRDQKSNHIGQIFNQVFEVQIHTVVLAVWKVDHYP